MPWPNEDEFAEFYKSYLNGLPKTNMQDYLVTQLENVIEVFSANENKSDYAYEPGKWTVKEVLGHITDTERILSFRALSIARGEKNSLPGFEQDDYVKEGFFNSRNFKDLLNEFIYLRKANILMFKSFSDEVLMRRGKANNYEFTVNAFMHIIPGHVQHHLKVLEEKYF